MRMADREAAWEKRLVRIAEWLEASESGELGAGAEGVQVLEVRMLLNAREAGDTLLVLKGCRAGEPVVAFVGALNVGQAVLTWRQKTRAGKLKWREDRPWPRSTPEAS